MEPFLISMVIAATPFLSRETSTYGFRKTAKLLYFGLASRSARDVTHS